MGQGHGRRTSLDDRKERAAGRRGSEKGPNRAPDAPPQVKGAFGPAAGKTNRRVSGLRKGRGGGGGTH